jgi:hypothetical protein
MEEGTVSSRQCCGSGMFVKEFKYFNHKNPKKWFLSSRKYDPGCSSRIRMLTFYPSRIPDPGVKKAPDPRSWIRIRNTASRKYVRAKVVYLA